MAIPRWLVGLSAAASAAAGAQDQAYVAKMREVNAQSPAPEPPAVQPDALATLQVIARRTGDCVPTGVAIEQPTPATADRMAIQGIQAGKLKNLWLVYGTPTGCPGAVKTRFIVLQLPDGSIHARVVNKGESLTSPSLMRDTSNAAALAAWSAAKAVDAVCDGHDIAFNGSRVASRSQDLGPDFYGERFRGAWQEVWIFGVCGRSAAVPVGFQTDGAGGAYTHVEQKAVIISTPTR